MQENSTKKARTPVRAFIFGRRFLCLEDRLVNRVPSKQSGIVYWPEQGGLRDTRDLFSFLSARCIAILVKQG